MEVMLWNSVLSVLIGLIGFIMASKFKELDRIGILLNRTREEVARDHITRQELKAELREIIDRFDRIENKLDRMMSGERLIGGTNV